jgi:enamine deaminase RidA (YjgF/YER057c/UK114 family)
MPMVKRYVELTSSSKVYCTSVDDRQLYCTASVTDPQRNPFEAASELYDRVAEILAGSSMQIVHERLFGDLSVREAVLKARKHAETDADWPVTYIDGRSCFDAPFTGVQIRAVRPVAPDDNVWTAYDEGLPVGRAWNRNGSTFLILQDCHGKNGPKHSNPTRPDQAETMFRRAERILRDEGFSYGDVVRTWIYIADILDWYGDFNMARNRCYTDFGFLGPKGGSSSAETLYLPASTGIAGRNPAGSAAVMDLFAVRHDAGSSVRVRHITGTRQRSPFRYGSAFSRAVVVDEPDGKLILVSGTASIDEEGKSVHPGDCRAQILQTLQVISTLVEPEGATLEDLCEATVFLKRKGDLPLYLDIAEEKGLSSAPAVHVVADVCRDELLFELDAAFVVGKNR